jgi:anthranilate synthase/aminodeoxychorismate synthase-like glutamine amidotransferase
MKTRPHLLLLDNYDSFTYNLYDYLLRLGCTCEVWRNDAFAHPQDLPSFDALVLSPGPGRPAESGRLMEVIAYFHHQKPILGVCLGHQALGEFFGARLSHALKPVHGKTAPILHQGQDLFEGLPPACTMMRYHSLVLQDLPNCLKALAHTAEGELMAMRHEHLPLWGVQFHPESILSPHGLALLANWLRLAGLN